MIATLALASCSSDAEQQRRLLAQITSWIASAEMIADARTTRLVPAVFSGPALERCSREIATLAEQLNQKKLSATQSAAITELPSVLMATADSASRRDRERTDYVVASLQRIRRDLGRATETP